MTLALIACMAQNYTIGNDNEMPWHLTTDLIRFKNLTISKPVVMGRKTFESIGNPLVDRQNIVLSKTKGLNEFVDKGNVIVLPTVEQVLCYTRIHPESFVIGGGEIYRLFMPLADKIYLSVIPKNYDGDTTFPEIDDRYWKKDHAELVKDPLINYHYYEFIRIRPNQ